MPLNLDSCIAGVFTPGNIGASSGLPPVQPIVPSLDGTPPALAELATAIDTLDYFMGDLLYEPASASDSYTATGGAYELLISEPASAADAVSVPQVFNEAVGEVAQATDVPLVYVPGIVSASIAEAVAANDAPDGAVVSVAFTTFDPATVTDVTLSGGNLVATHANFNSNAGVRSTAYKTTGKYYFEFTIGVTGADNVVGVILSTGTYGNFVSGNGDGSVVKMASGIIWSNNANSGKALGAIVAGNKIGVAIDLAARKAWFHKNGGNWNGDATHNPGTGAGGVTMFASGSHAPCAGFALNFSTTDVVTANFGASAFTYAVPSGFTSGWA